jgi:lactoylglutathione lyase
MAVSFEIAGASGGRVGGMLKLGYVILYSPDVAASLAFYEGAFSLQRRFLHESGAYGELDTGNTVLAFAHESMAKEHGFTIRPSRPGADPAAFELAFVTDDVASAYARAVAAGAEALSPPEAKPWGQTVGYVKDKLGVLIEICSPVTP